MNLAFFLEDLFGRRVDLLTPEGISHRISPMWRKRWCGLIKDDSVFFGHILDEITFLTTHVESLGLRPRPLLVEEKRIIGGFHIDVFRDNVKLHRAIIAYIQP